MPDILHQFPIGASLQRVFAAVTAAAETDGDGTRIGHEDFNTELVKLGGEPF